MFLFVCVFVCLCFCLFACFGLFVFVYVCFVCFSSFVRLFVWKPPPPPRQLGLKVSNFNFYGLMGLTLGVIISNFSEVRFVQKLLTADWA